MKLGIGTVQFGLEYGIQQRRICSEQDVAHILSDAAQLGIKVIDTAESYRSRDASSEGVLGKLLPLHHSFNIVTKFSAPADCSVSNIIRQIEMSLVRLNQKKIAGILWHKPDELLSPKAEIIWQGLIEAKKLGWVNKIGVSIYNAYQIEKIVEKFPIELIQVPCSILDQRLIQNGWLQKLKDKNVEIHARSVFLQGALLVRPEQLPAHLKHPVFLKFFQDCQSKNESALRAALRFALDQPEIDTVVVGVSSHQEFMQITQAAQMPSRLEDYSGYAIHDEAIINPMLWAQPVMMES